MGRKREQLRMISWHRPSGSPKIWKIIEGNSKDGSKKSIKFSIQEIPDSVERKQEVLDLIRKHYLTDEPLCAYESKFTTFFNRDEKRKLKKFDPYL